MIDALVTVAHRAARPATAPARATAAPARVYIVKPKMHGPDEVAFADELFGARRRRCSAWRATPSRWASWTRSAAPRANLKACIRAATDRIVFINTGFLDRTGDEIHTSMEAGPVLRKDDMKAAAWIAAYEDRNVDIGLASRLPGPGADRQGHVGDARPHGRHAEDQDRPSAGRRQHRLGALAHRRHAARAALPPGRRGGAAGGADAPQAARRPRRHPDASRWPTGPTGRRTTSSSELDNNAQGILGYVVRWIDQGVGCSKVPDIHDVGLMEDRATLRISSQHIANWLHHGICTRGAGASRRSKRMAAVVDRRTPATRSTGRWRPTSTAASPSRRRCDLVFKGREQPNGYTEPVLHRRRRELKRKLAS